MIDRLAGLEARYEEISASLSTPEAASDPSRLAELGRELSRLEPIVNGLRLWRSTLAQLDEVRGLSEDPDDEMRAMARDEVERLSAQAAELESDLRLRL